MFINALNDLNITNEPCNMLNFGMEHVASMLSVEEISMATDESGHFAFKPDIFPLEITILPCRWTSF